MTHPVVSFAKQWIDIDSYLPELKNANKLPERTWVCNLGEFSHLIIISEHSFSR